MGNLIVGFPLGAIHPYVGAGAGWAHFSANDTAAPPLGPLDGSDGGLALQAFAGVDLSRSGDMISRKL